MRAVALIARKEVRDGLRNRWVVAIAALLAIFALTLGLLGAAPTGEVKVSPLAVTIVSLSSLSIFLLPLIGLLLSYDAIVGEWERGTLALLLAYPVARWQVMLGKFAGHLSILAIATVAGYCAAGAVLSLTSDASADAWGAFATMTGSSVLLGAVFVAIGYVISTLVRDRATAGGIAIGVWLLLVVVYDMAMLGVLVADQGRNLDASAVSWMLLLNPADAYRLLNLAGTSTVSVFAGVSGLASQAGLSPAASLGSLVLWTAAPLAFATALFARRQV
jgi:Cu-processing system permease protein